MDTFLRLAGIATLVIGGSWMTPAIAGPSADPGESTDILFAQTSVIRSTLLSDYEPPNNGGPSTDTQGAGGR